MKAVPIFVLISTIVLVNLGTALADHHKELRAGIEAAEKEWVKAWNARDLDTLLSLYSKDVKALPPGQDIVKGKQELKKFLESEFKESEGLIQELKIIDVVGQGNLATEIGKWVMRDKKTKKSVDEGTYMVLWRKEGGKWMTVWETFNSSKKEEADSGEK